MRFKIFAAAVSAVVLSAAFQSVEAGIITIDDFYQAQSATQTGSGFTVGANDVQSGSFGGFTDRELAALYVQAAPRGFRSVSGISNGSGTGTLQLTNNGAGTGTTGIGEASGYFGYLATLPVDLTGQQYPGFWIETGATSSTPAGAFTGFIVVSTLNGTETVQYDLPGMWAPNAGTGILFADLLAINPLLDFTSVDAVYVGIVNLDPLAGSTPYSATANFTTITVPEPSTYAMGFAGLACGAWQMVRRRRAL